MREALERIAFGGWRELEMAGIARRALAAPSPGKCGAYGYCDRDVVPGTTWCEKHADDRASSPGTAPPADAPRPKPFYVDHLLDDPPAASAEDALLAGSDDAADPAPVRPVGPAGRVARHLEDLPEPPCETCGGTRYVGGALSANGHEPCPRCSPHPKESP